MKIVLVALFLFLCACQHAHAQEEEMQNTEEIEEYGSDVVYAHPSDAVESAIQHAHDVTALYLYEESLAPMVSPRRCVRREFRIPTMVAHPRAGMVIRIERGECLLEHPYFVHNPVTHRIYLIDESEAIAILESIVALMENPASG